MIQKVINKERIRIILLAFLCIVFTNIVVLLFYGLMGLMGLMFGGTAPMAWFIGMYLFLFIFATTATYFTIVIISKIISDDKWKFVKNVFWVYIFITTIIFLFNLLFQAEILLPVHIWSFAIFAPYVSSQENTLTGLGTVLSVSSLSLIYYLLYRKFRKT